MAGFREEEEHTCGEIHRCVFYILLFCIRRAQRHQDRRQWCIATGEIVQEFRIGGAWCTRPPYRKLLWNIFALVYGLTFNLGDIGVVNDTVTDGIGQSRIVQVFMPLVGVVLEAEDSGNCSTQLRYPT